MGAQAPTAKPATDESEKWFWKVSADAGSAVAGKPLDVPITTSVSRRVLSEEILVQGGW